jgi:DNA-binding CsgD family transcriptional regulator
VTPDAQERPTRRAERQLASLFEGCAGSSPFPQLTEREHEVLASLAAGRDNAAVAHRLGVSSKTVRNHVSNIITKLHVVDRSGAIIRARDAGMGGGANSSGEGPPISPCWPTGRDISLTYRLRHHESKGDQHGWRIRNGSSVASLRWPLQSRMGQRSVRLARQDDSTPQPTQSAGTRSLGDVRRSTLRTMVGGRRAPRMASSEGASRRCPRGHSCGAGGAADERLPDHSGDREP